MVLVMPVITLAARTLKDLIDLAIEYLGYAIPLIMSLAIVTFIWGIYKYFFKVDADKKEAGNLVLFGVIGFFLMLSFWGLVNVLANTLNLQTMPTFGVPFIRSSGGGSGTVNVGGNSGGSGRVNVGGNSGGGTVPGKRMEISNFDGI